MQYQADSVCAHSAAIAAAGHWQETAAAAAADDAAAAAAVAAAAKMVTAQRLGLKLKESQSPHCKSQTRPLEQCRGRTSQTENKTAVVAAPQKGRDSDPCSRRCS